MNQLFKEEKDKKFEKLQQEFETAKKNYQDYFKQFITQFQNGKIMEVGKFLTPESEKNIKRLEDKMNETAKEIWDYVCLIAFPNK